MRGITRLLVCGGLFALTAAGCCGPAQRANQRPAAVQKLSAVDRGLVLHGHIRPGLSRDAVYVAWGAPDDKFAGRKGSDESETWIYRHRLTIYEPFNSYDYFGPRHGLKGYPTARLWQPGYPGGGIGYEGALLYQPHLLTLHTERIVVFGGAGVDRYKAENGVWSSSPPSPVSPGSPVPAATSEPLNASRMTAGMVEHKSTQARTSVVSHPNHRRNHHLVAAAPAPRRMHTAYPDSGKNQHDGTAQHNRSKAHLAKGSTSHVQSGSHVHHSGHPHGGAARKFLARTG